MVNRMMQRVGSRLGLAIVAVSLCLAGCPEDEETGEGADGGSATGAGAGESGGNAGEGSGNAGEGSGNAGEGSGNAGEGGSSTGSSTVEGYTGVKTDDCKSASPICELFCNMICNNCGVHAGQMNGCGPAQGFAKDATDDNTWCLNCQAGIDAWASTCTGFSEVPAPIGMCEEPVVVEKGPECVKLAACCVGQTPPFDTACNAVSDAKNEDDCKLQADNNWCKEATP